MPIIILTSNKSSEEINIRNIEFAQAERQYSSSYNISDSLYNRIADVKINEYLGYDIRKDLINETGNFWGGVFVFLDDNLLKVIKQRREAKEKRVKESQQVARRKQRKQAKAKVRKQRKANARRKRKRMGRMKLKAVVVKGIPYNVDLNIPSEDGLCMTEYIAKKHKKLKTRYTGETVNHLIEYCTERKVQLKLFNIFGDIIIDNQLCSNKNLPAIRGVVTNEHFYPLTGRDMKLKFGVEGSSMYGPVPPGYVDFEKDNKVYADKIYHTKDKINFIDAVKGCYLEEDRDVLREGIKALYYSDESTFGYCQDMNGCYWNVAKGIKRVGLPSVNDNFKKYNGGKLNEHDWYILKPNKNLKFLGKRENVCGYNELLSIKRLYPEVKIDMIFRHKASVDFPDVSKMSKDDFKIQNGVWGKHKNYIKTIVEVESRESRLLQADNEELIDLHNGKLMKREQWDMSHVNNNYLYFNVVSNANAVVINSIADIYKKHLLMPIKIRTDSLSYTESIKILKGWKSEEFKPMIDCVDTVVKYKPRVYDNKTVTGKPGVGKSTLVKNKYKYDKATSHFSAVAANNGGSTLCKLLGYSKEDDKFLKRNNGCKYNNEIWWHDEFSNTNRDVLNHQYDVYMRFNIKFIFTGDINQYPPVNEPSLELNQFFGEVTELKKQYRMEAKLEKVTDEVLLNDKYDLKRSKKQCNFAICYTKKKCVQVADEITKRLGIKWGDKAKYYCRESHDKYIKGLIYTKPSGNVKKWCWGYALTSHKIQYSTIEEDYNIYQWGRLSKAGKYVSLSRAKKLSQIHIQ